MRLAGMDNLSPECNMQHPWHLQKGGPDIVSLPYLQSEIQMQNLGHWTQAKSYYYTIKFCLGVKLSCSYNNYFIIIINNL